MKLEQESHLASSYDEMVTGSGSIRPHWRGLIETISGMTAETLAERSARLSAQMAESEIIARPDARAASSAPSLDLLPLILPESEWEGIAAGLVQRARLFNAILSDLYGPQQLIEEKLLPPYLVLGNPEFLRPLCNVQPKGETPHVYFYAADLVREPTGEWRVFANRTQTPAGAGYALYKRSALARTFPEIFRRMHVRRIESFFEVWKSSLHDIGSEPDPAQIVLLTPGPRHKSYFEHVFLARALGISLVQSADLTVRNDFVYLKTLEGLVKVDVIYRCVDGSYCDSLELREDSELGVAGLVEVARARNIAILNMPGSALVECPAFTPFLQNLAQRLLGEDIRLPAVTTWWCGQKDALAEVRVGLDGFVLHRVFDADPIPIQPALLSAAERKDFESQILAHPEQYVAREKLSPSVAPCLVASDAARQAGRFVPRPVILRAMTVWHGGNWYAMPGGSAHVVTEQSVYRNMIRHSSLVKDTWVLSEQELEHRMPVKVSPGSSARAERHTALRSRTVDDLFWLGRQIERLDSGARQFLAIIHRLTSGGLSAREQAELKRLAEALKSTGWIDRSAAEAPVHGMMFFDSVMRAAVGGVAIRTCFQSIRRLTMAVRDQLSLNMWRTLQQLTDSVQGSFDRAYREPDQLLKALDRCIVSIATFSGLAAENMVRGARWHFLDLGRRIERGIAVAQVVRGLMSGPTSHVEAGLRLSLEVCDSIYAYLLRYPLETDYAQALGFVLADRNNPRALVHQLVRIQNHLGVQGVVDRMSGELATVYSLIGAVETFTKAFTEDGNVAGEGSELFELLDRVVGNLMQISDAITSAFFTHIAVARPINPAQLVPAETK